MSGGGSKSSGLKDAFLIVLLLVSLGGAVVGGCVLAFQRIGWAKPDAVSILAADGPGSRPKLVVREGETLWFAFYEDSSLQGYWATNGLTLRVDGWAAPITVVGPKKATWGSHISNSVSADFTVVGRLKVPRAPAKSGNLTGRIDGRITMPRKLLDPIMHTPGTFTDVDQDISVPVNLVVIGAEDPAESAYEAAFGGRPERKQKLLWTAFLGGLAGLWLAAKLAPKPPQPAEPPGQQGGSTGSPSV